MFISIIFRQLEGETSTCDFNSCEYIATYQRDNAVAHFELMAKGEWVALGFSSDELMV